MTSPDLRCMTSPDLRWEVTRPRLAAATGVCGAIAVGFAYPLLSFGLPAFVVPALVLGAALVAVSFRRMEIGIAVALILVMLNPAMIDNLAWLPGLTWVLVLGLLCALRAPLWFGPIPGVAPVRSGTRPSALTVAVVAYAAVLVGGTVLTPDIAAATPLLRSTFTGIVLFTVIVVSVRTRAQMRWVFAGVAAAATLPCVWVLFFPDSLGPEARGYGRLDASGALFERLGAGYAHPNQFAALLLLLLPVLIAAAIMDRAARLPYLIVSVLTVVALLGTLSRAALLGLPLVPLFFLALRRSGLAGPLAVGALVLTALVASGSSLLPAGIGVADESSGSTVPFAGRLDFWLVALDVWGEHPVLGAGPGSFPQAYAETPHVGKAYLPDTLVEAPPHAHNLFLHTLAENGLVGLVVLIGLLATLAAVAVRLIRRRDHWARPLGAAGLGLLAAFLVQNQLDVTLFEVNTVMFFSLLGLLKAAANLPKDDHALLR